VPDISHQWPSDAVEYIKKLEKRIERLERAPRALTSTGTTGTPAASDIPVDSSGGLTGPNVQTALQALYDLVISPDLFV
jgi:hypothetical protein